MITISEKIKENNKNNYYKDNSSTYVKNWRSVELDNGLYELLDAAEAMAKFEVSILPEDLIKILELAENVKKVTLALEEKVDISLAQAE